MDGRNFLVHGQSNGEPDVISGVVGGKRACAKVRRA